MSEIEIEKVTDRTKKVFQYMEMGLSTKEAYQLVKPGKDITRQHEHRLQKMFEKYSLSSPKFAKLANKAIEDTLAMREISGQKPTVSNRLAAASMVLDRIDPIINKNMNVNVNMDVSPVDLTKYRQE